MKEKTVFELSRIYAQGWNAANRLSSGETSEADVKNMAALNPYTADPERTRWNEGFAGALRG